MTVPRSQDSDCKGLTTLTFDLWFLSKTCQYLPFTWWIFVASFT